MSSTLLTKHTLEEHRFSLASFVPNDKLHATKNLPGEVLHDILLGLSHELLRCETALVTLQNDFFPSGTDALLPEWERVLGIPDSCFSGTGTVEERQRDVLIKLASLGVQTAADFINLATLFGVNANVAPGNTVASFPYTFPILFLTAADSRFTIIVDFTGPSSPAVATMECLFNKLKPANTQLIFREI